MLRNWLAGSKTVVSISRDDPVSAVGRFYLVNKQRTKYAKCAIDKAFRAKNPPKWQKNDLVSGGHGRAAKLRACVNWVEWLRPVQISKCGLDCALL